MESDFYARHGIGKLLVPPLEYEVLLEPGQLLFVDNTRVVHGRDCVRRLAREIFNFMFGVASITDAEVAQLRRALCEQLAG